MRKYSEVNFGDLVGQAIKSMEVNYDEMEIIFCTPTKKYVMFHDQN